MFDLSIDSMFVYVCLSSRLSVNFNDLSKLRPPANHVIPAHVVCVCVFEDAASFEAHTAHDKTQRRHATSLCSSTLLTASIAASVKPATQLADCDWFVSSVT